MSSSVPLTSIDLFSGLGGISVALHPFATPVLYCEKDHIATSVLKANMVNGTLRDARIHPDVCTLSSDPDLPQADMVIAGVPCVGFSSLGLRQGFDNSQSNLFFDMLAVCDKCGCGCIFLENVPGIMRFKNTLIDELAVKRGFVLRWMVQSASELGAVHHRKRWYALAFKPQFALDKLATMKSATTTNLSIGQTPPLLLVP
jgi:DNA (cytosine-5)-methyltransferase 1